MPRRTKPAGLYIDENGYPRISMGPYRGKRLHVLIAEAMLGRELKPDEIVHHIDGNKGHYHWRNLKVLSFRDHNALTAKQYWVMRKKEKADRLLWEEWHGEGSTRELHDQHDTSFDPGQFG